LEFFLISILAIITLCISWHTRRITRIRDEEKLMQEIDNDFQEEFNLKEDRSANTGEDRLERVVEWIEDVQLEDDIEKKI
tara:strand:- start:1204 stop:1443 length:240 start_codon:yes stop_codon:yes gene_type:complete